MKIYVVFEIDADFIENDECDACWKVVKAFTRQEDAKKYIQEQKYLDDYHIEEIELMEGV